jgi:hypothetical protein
MLADLLSEEYHGGLDEHGHLDGVGVTLAVPERVVAVLS